jgi:hypothetical protein
MVELANALSQTSAHKLAYIHMPVPIERSDDAFHRPFGALALPPGTELYLGVVHAKDGVVGAEARIAAARRYAPSFGIATECGMARARTEATVRALLGVHAHVCGGADADRD